MGPENQGLGCKTAVEETVPFMLADGALLRAPVPKNSTLPPQTQHWGSNPSPASLWLVNLSAGPEVIGKKGPATSTRSNCYYRRVTFH